MGDLGKEKIMSKYHMLEYAPCTMEKTTVSAIVSSIAGTVCEIERLILDLECEVDYLNQSVFKNNNKGESNGNG